MTSSTDKKRLIAKARGFTISISNMVEAQRGETPSGGYGEDYNKLVGFVRVSYSDLDQFLPPLVTFYSISNGKVFTQQSFGEIDTYCEQLCQLLGTVD